MSCLFVQHLTRYTQTTLLFPACALVPKVYIQADRAVSNCNLFLENVNCLVQVRLRTEVVRTPSSTRPGFVKLMTSRS